MTNKEKAKKILFEEYNISLRVICNTLFNNDEALSEALSVEEYIKYVLNKVKAKK
jgi:hypothetical protein